MIHDENNVLTDDELVIVRDFLKMPKHACLYIRNEHLRGFKVLNHVWGDHFKWISLLINWTFTNEVFDFIHKYYHKYLILQEIGNESYVI